MPVISVEGVIGVLLYGIFTISFGDEIDGGGFRVWLLQAVQHVNRVRKYRKGK